MKNSLTILSSDEKKQIEEEKKVHISFNKHVCLLPDKLIYIPTNAFMIVHIYFILLCIYVFLKKCVLVTGRYQVFGREAISDEVWVTYNVIVFNDIITTIWINNYTRSSLNGVKSSLVTITEKEKSTQSTIIGIEKDLAGKKSEIDNLNKKINSLKK